MNTYVEWFVMFIAAIFLIIIGYRWLYRWLHAPADIHRIKLGKGGKINDNDPNVQLLRKRGYMVLSGRHVIPVAIELDGNIMEPATKIYIDYMVEKKGLTYIVRFERERKPMDWTTPVIRDRLLMYALLLPECAGIIYVNYKEQTLRKIMFHFLD